MRRRLDLSVVSLLALSALLACSSTTHAPLIITVDKSTVLVSSPVRVMVSGLDPGEAATLAVSTADAGGYVWSSSASFKADGNGQIDLSRATPSGGSYTEADGMGLFGSMKPTGQSPLPTFLVLPGVNEIDKIGVTAGGRG